MLKKIFTNQLSYPTSELQDQLEQTADLVIKNLESHITHLEDLLSEADEHIELLDNKIRQAQQIPNRLRPAELQLTSHRDQQTIPGANNTILSYGVTRYQQHTTSWLAATDMDQASNLVKSPDIKLKDSKNNGLEPTSQSISQQRQVISAMFKQGYTTTEIAKATGFGQGEISLFFQLHKND